MGAPTPLYEHKTRQSFVSPKVKENAYTTRILDAIFPYYRKQVTVIGGYLSQDDAVWKIDWHWESLIHVIDVAVGEVGLSEAHQKAAQAVRAVLMTNPPKPASGYRAKNTLGDPKDESSMDTVLARWRILKQSKKDFASVVRKAGIEEALSKATGSLSVLVVQPVLPPSLTNHRFGWAIDVKGRPGKLDNPEIVKTSKSLGATLTYDEQFHIHVEFKSGVKIGTAAPHSGVPDPPPASETAKPPAPLAPAREASRWDVSELLKTTGRGWQRLLEDLF